MSSIQDMQNRNGLAAMQGSQVPVQVNPGQQGLAQSGLQQTIQDLSRMIATGSREDAIRATQFAADDPQMLEMLKPAIAARQEMEAQQMVR